MNKSSVQVYLYGNTRNDHSNLVLKKHGEKKAETKCEQSSEEQGSTASTACTQQEGQRADRGQTRQTPNFKGGRKHRPGADTSGNLVEFSDKGITITRKKKREGKVSQT